MGALPAIFMADGKWAARPISADELRNPDPARPPFPDEFVEVAVTSPPRPLGSDELRDAYGRVEAGEEVDPYLAAAVEAVKLRQAINGNPRKPPLAC